MKNQISASPAIGLMQMNFGPSHEDVTTIREWLADSFLMQEKYDEAERTYRGILTVFERIKLNPDDPHHISLSEKLDFASKGRMNIIEIEKEANNFIGPSGRWFQNNFLLRFLIYVIDDSKQLIRFKKMGTLI